MERRATEGGDGGPAAVRRGGGDAGTSATAHSPAGPPPERPRRGRRRAAWALVLLGLTCVGLWIASVAAAAAGAATVGAEAPPAASTAGPSWPSAVAVGAFLVALAVWSGVRFAGAVRRPGHRRRRALALAAVTAVALLLRLTGLDHELVDRPYLDEGTYWHHAQQIDAGQPWSASFVYPHLLYYADAFTLWAAEPFRPALAAGVGVVLGGDHPAATDPLALDWLLLRLLVALAGALTVVPVFRVAEVVAAGRGGGGTVLAGTAAGGVGLGSDGPLGRGLAAGVMGGLFLAFAPLYNEISHLNISDLPSAFFAALCLATCARLLLAESAAGYLAAGAFSGLAAACKYPAGVVAVAVAAVWAYHRWAARRRRSDTRREGTRGATGAPAEAADGERPPAAGAVPAGGTAPWPPGLRQRVFDLFAGGLGLFTAGAASLAVFLAATPSLFLYPRQALTGGRGIFFGVRQYAGGGWIGVQPDSNLLYYGRLVVHELGWPALSVALAGLAGLATSAAGRRVLARLAWLAPFPVAYLLLVGGMNMVVRRNLLPAVPPLAALAGVGVVAAGVAVRRWWQRRAGVAPAGAPPSGAAPSGAAAGRGLAAAGVVLAALLLTVPAARSVTASFAMARPSTRELARAWLVEHAPPGSAVVRESYGPELPPERFAVWRSRFAARFPLDELRTARVDYLVLASAAYERFLDPERHAREHHATYGAWYRQVFADTPRVAEIVPGRLTWGPVIRIHRLPAAEHRRRAQVVPAARMFVPDGGMRPAGRGRDGRGAAVSWFRPGQWSLAKADLAAGAWRLEIDGEVAAGGESASPESASPGGAAPEGGSGAPRLRLLLDGERLAGLPGSAVPLAGPGHRSATFEVPADGRLYAYLDLPLGSRIEAVRLVPVADGAGP